MEAIYIPQLAKAPEQTERLTVREHLPDLETLTPVQGLLRVTHNGTYLEVAAQAETIVTLTCDRCLQQYNYRLQADATELIWLEEPADDPETVLPEREVALEELVEAVSPQGHFHPDTWLYEQLCLALPQRQLCDQQCQGIPLENNPAAAAQPVDSRWASLEALKRQLPN